MQPDSGDLDHAAWSARLRWIPLSLEEMIAQRERTLWAIAVLVAIPVALAFDASLTAAVTTFGIGCAFVLCSLFATGWYRAADHGVRELLVFLQIQQWVLVASAFWCASNLRLAFHEGQLYDDFSGIGFVIGLVVLALSIWLQDRFWTAGKRCYAMLATYRAAGAIDGAELFRLLSEKDEDGTAERRIRWMVGLVFAVIVIASFTLIRDELGWVIYVAIALMLCPYKAAQLLVELRWQVVSLGTADIEIT